MTYWFSGYRCGCTLLTDDHQHPTYCPGCAPGLTEWGNSSLAARTERLGQTETVPTALAEAPGVSLGLECGSPFGGVS